jgi:hypothetical protein
MISLVPTEEIPSVRNSRDAFDTIRALDSAVSDLDFRIEETSRKILASFRDPPISKRYAIKNWMAKTKGMN